MKVFYIVKFYNGHIYDMVYENKIYDSMEDAYLEFNKLDMYSDSNVEFEVWEADFISSKN